MRGNGTFCGGLHILPTAVPRFGRPGVLPCPGQVGVEARGLSFGQSRGTRAGLGSGSGRRRDSDGSGLVRIRRDERAGHTWRSSAPWAFRVSTWLAKGLVRAGSGRDGPE